MRRIFTCLAYLLFALLLPLAATAQQEVITTAIGGGPNNMPALSANLNNPYGVAVDKSGNYYIAAYDAQRIYKVDSSGTLTVVAGSGVQGYSGDGVLGGAIYASLYHPVAIAVDASGNIYFSDFSNCVVRKVDTAKTITTVAGIGKSCGFSGDGGPATSAQLNAPYGVALDNSGNLYFGDYYNCNVRKVVLATGTITSYAGSHSCGYSGDNGAATSAQLYYPAGVAADTTGNLFIIDSQNCVIREVAAATGVITTIAGNHTCGFTGDGGPATSAEMNKSYGLTVNASGTVVTFSDYSNQRIRQFTVGGNISTVAGNGTYGFTGDGGAATSAELRDPIGVAQTATGTFYIADYLNYRIRSFTVGGNINSVAGNGSATAETLIEGANPVGVMLNYPYQISIDKQGNTFVADNYNERIRQLVRSNNQFNTFAGNGILGYTGDGGPATGAELNHPVGMVKDSLGNVYISDTNNCVIRKVDTTGVISTFAGVNRCDFYGDGGPATSAAIYHPYGLAVDSKNNLYIADYDNYVVRKVTNGTISTIAGIGRLAGYSGDGGPATSAMLYHPASLAIDAAGNVFIADAGNCRVREVSALTGLITTVAGNGTCSYTGDGPATQVSLNQPQGVGVDANENLLVGDTNNHRVRWISPNGYMTTIAGTGTAGYAGDGSVATAAQLYYPAGVAFDSTGNVLISDQYNHRVRSVAAFAALNLSSSNLFFDLTQVGSTSFRQTIVLSALGSVTINSITVSANFIEVDNCPATLASEQTCVMDVYFQPTKSGTLTGTINISTNGYFTSSNTIYLTGVGSSTLLTGAPLNFGNQQVKTTSAPKTVTLTNTGTAAITMGTITLTQATDFTISANTCPANGSKLNGGASCTISVTFSPKSTGLKKGTVVINDSDPSSPQQIGLSGTGTSNVALSPTSLTFPTTPIGVTSASMQVTLTNNTGGSITLGSPAVTLTGPFASSAGTTCTNNLVIAATGTCVIRVTFKPTQLGFAGGTLSVSDSDGTSPQSIPLQGTGTGVSFTPPNINFGTVTKGTQVSSTVTLTNVGPTTILFAGEQIVGPNSPDFTTNSGNPPCSGSLVAGGSCTFTMYFKPNTTSVENATYYVYDNSPGSPQALPLTGTGK